MKVKGFNQGIGGIGLQAEGFASYLEELSSDCRGLMAWIKSVSRI